jgi:catecholate siderophore receptor
VEPVRRICAYAFGCTDGGYTLVAGAYVPAASTGRRAPNTPMDSMTLTSQYKITPRFTLGGSAIFNSKVYGGFA